eukprot:6449259-Lingulodinium_polyedra.AAC.1
MAWNCVGWCWAGPEAPAFAWPATVAQYPPQGSPGHWQDMLGLAEELNCVQQAGGQRAATRHSRRA